MNILNTAVQVNKVNERNLKIPSY